MITYELALKLKEAGFPQKTCDHAGFPLRDKPYPPNLSELIEACGDGLSYQYKDEFGKWYAKEHSKAGVKAFKVFLGRTPEEAVANLLLHLLSGKIVNDEKSKKETDKGMQKLRK